MALVEFERQPSLNWLPPELMSEILVKLPVKSLLQFKCISKYYLALICSPQFVKFHVNYNEQRGLILRFTVPNPDKYEVRCIRSDSDPDIYVPFGVEFRIVGCVNGLICLAIMARLMARHFYLWNPSIRKFKKLTATKPVPTTYGFGYDETHDDYKMVTIFSHVRVELYSVKNNSWKRIDDLQGHKILTRPGKLVNGKLHWLTTCNIISIDLADEKWGKMEYPCSGDCDFQMKLGVLGSDLSMVRKYDKIFLDVWIRKESWAKIYTIKFPPNISNRIPNPNYCMLNGGEVLFLVGTRFMIYNPKDGSIRSLEVAECHGYYFAAARYVESLVFPFQN